MIDLKPLFPDRDSHWIGVVLVRVWEVKITVLKHQASWLGITAATARHYQVRIICLKTRSFPPVPQAFAQISHGMRTKWMEHRQARTRCR
jgi:hypothetical protein